MNMTPTSSHEDGIAGSGDASLYEECVAMFGASVAVPASTNLRILAKEGKLTQQDADRVLTLPTTFGSVVEVFLKNKELLLEEFKHDVGIPYHITALERLQKTYPEAMASEIMVFDDEHRTSELVYGISVNRLKKTITLVFRGSVTPKDYQVDFNILMRGIPNPIQEGSFVNVHAGFSEYLLKEKEGKSKFDEILGHLRTLFESHPGYRLYVTGHSLGGSLAILTAFKLAALSVTSGPIRLITFGAMLVGDLRFRRAFQAMERAKQILCLCVVNHGDLIPLIPRRGSLLKTYRCAGNQLQMSRSKTAVSYPPESSQYCGAYLMDIPNQIIHAARLSNTFFCRKNFWEHHSVIETVENLSGVAEDLKKMSLNDIYASRGY